ncbi:flagellin [Asticcacaulis sp. AC402]|uniref:flagellin n=1 Tax=Asticcacaulis sp. AC402 TaxID=1282361 RepID=UPI0003C3DF49|nr:flagellin [Asticcacaulis sp. AC402]ESQ75992.1 flagellin [Asticcacaulis sp. AC402]
MRVSTSATWSNALNNLMKAQERQNAANDRVSTQKVATDLMGYGRSSEIIAAYQATLAKTSSYIAVNKSVAERLNSQDLALNTTSEGASNAKEAILNALASNSGASLMETIQGAFSIALQGLNFEHHGQYLFAGGNDSQDPITVGSLSELAQTDIDDVFANGNVRKTSRIDASTTLRTGMLASELGGDMMQLFKDIQEFNSGPDGPFGTQLTEAQKVFLTQKSGQFSAVYDELVEQTSLNGTLQKRVETSQGALESQASSLNELIGSRTEADMASAYTALQQAQVSVQASAQVLSDLQSSSLLNLLR